MVKQKKKPIKKILKTKELHDIFKDKENTNHLIYDHPMIYNDYGYYDYYDLDFANTCLYMISIALSLVLLIAFLPIIVIFLLICSIFSITDNIVNGVRPYKNMEDHYDRK